jgi:hypothetical protein
MKFLSVCIELFLFTYCLCNIYDTIVSKDDHLCRLLKNPEGIDDILIDEYRAVANLFGALAEEVKNRNESVIEEAKNIYERGEPKFLSLKYSLGRLKLHYNWGHRESNFFEFLNLNAKYKWQDFEQEFKNYTIEQEGKGELSCGPTDCV